MISQTRRRSIDGSGHTQQSIFIAAFPKKNPTKGSNAANFDRVHGNRRGESNQNWTQKFPKAPRSTYLRKPSDQEEVSEREFKKPARPRSPDDEPLYRPILKDEANSTASSEGQPKPTLAGPTKPIDDFMVAVMGDVFDGIKYQGKHHRKFAAASLCAAPEANQLLMPDP